MTYFFYDKVIKNKQNILPDFTTVANEIWIIILVFLYQVANKIELPQDGTIKRKEGYLTSKYLGFKQEYGKVIDKKFVHPHLRALVYAIIIYENFNRPWLARIVENLRFKLTKKPHTLGVMQVYTREYISDIESVEKGTDKILNLFRKSEDQYYNRLVAK
ncbi:hypothetical protein [Hymenobacter siberiensis]|uniref:hypothetical protein n=1 Tax=Hymenobacter siberiensis TaxID=2848396 RepID=UPI001C1E154D|nr:hypothetical protein [Hymenobacter siberiensis]MBU6123127.1 hypothetical protein [Hymenobacter siberiensis]